MEDYTLAISKKVLKNMKTMRVFVLLSVVMVFFVATDLCAQNPLLSLELKNKPMKDILHTIEENSPYVFFFSDAIKAELDEKVDIRVKNVSIERVLDFLFSGTNLSYSIQERQVNIFTIHPQLYQSLTTPNLVKYEGVVLDKQGEALPGVNIYINAYSSGIKTDAEGAFSVYVAEGTSVEFSYVGFSTQKIRIGKRNPYFVVLEEDEKLIKEVLVIAYGTINKKDATGSVADVRLSDVVNAPSFSVEHALQGRVSGVDILSTTGEPGAKTSMRIRGTRSITATNEPLIVVDGIIKLSQDLTDINTEDIESISILKDASATAIYGSRGSNGVLIVQTKRGSVGKPQIKARVQIGFSQLPHGLDLMNASEFAQYSNDVAYFSTLEDYSFINQQSPQSSYPYPNPLALGRGTDWVKEVTRIAQYSTTSFSISGGSEKTKYFVSLSHNCTEGIIKKNDIRRYTGRLNVEHTVFSWLKLGLLYSNSYIKEHPSLIGIGGSNYGQNAIFLSPLLPTTAKYNPLWGDTGGQVFNNPSLTLQQVQSKQEKQSSNKIVTVELKPAPYFTLTHLFSEQPTQYHTYRYENATLPLNVDRGGVARRQENHTISIANETLLKYQRSTTDCSYELLLGHTLSSERENTLSLSGSGYLSDALTWNNMGGVPDKQNYSATSSFTRKVMQSYLARLDLHYKYRYFVTLSSRYDGASHFAENRKWAFFPSAAFRWTVSNEAALRSLTWLSHLSLRLSTGRTGNEGIGSYQSKESLYSTTNGYLFAGIQPVAYYPDRIASPKLTWEKTVMHNVALDIAVLKDRFSLSFEAYRSSTGDLLLTLQTPSHTGFSSYLTNVGKTSNRGVELTLDACLLKQNNSSWSTSFTLSHNKQRVENIGTERFVSVFNSVGNNPYMMYGYVKGYPLNALWGFQYGGTWKNQEEIIRNRVTKSYVSPSVYSPGFPRYYDVNHDGVLNEKDLVYLGNADPMIYGGVQNRITWKKFSLDFFFQYSLGGKIYNIAEQYMGNGSIYSNQYRYMAQAWHPVRNPHSDIPRAGSSVLLASDRIAHDASFLRFKSASIGYKIDSRKSGFLQDINLSVAADNLFLWKYYNGFDPDVSTHSSNSALRRIDNGAYPKSRTIVLSVQLNY